MKPTDLTDNQLAETCKALGHPARIKIFRHLLKEDRCICGHIVDVLPLAQSTVSQHLKVLKEAGLIDGVIDGPKTCYCVDKTMLARLHKSIGSFLIPMLEEKK